MGKNAQYLSEKFKSDYIADLWYNIFIKLGSK